MTTTALTDWSYFWKRKQDQGPFGCWNPRKNDRGRTKNIARPTALNLACNFVRYSYAICILYVYIIFLDTYRNIPRSFNWRFPNWIVCFLKSGYLPNDEFSVMFMRCPMTFATQLLDPGDWTDRGGFLCPWRPPGWDGLPPWSLWKKETYGISNQYPDDFSNPDPEDPHVDPDDFIQSNQLISRTGHVWRCLKFVSVPRNI